MTTTTANTATTAAATRLELLGTAGHTITKAPLPDPRLPRRTCQNSLPPQLRGGPPPALVPWAATDRRLVLVDIENIVGGSDATADDVRWALDALRGAIGLTENDIWRVACGRRLLTRATGALPQPVLLGTGPDGADLKLLEQMHPDLVVGQFRSVALASADARAFTGAVATLARAGVPTDLYIGAGHLGHALAGVARNITDIGSLRQRAA